MDWSMNDNLYSHFQTWQIACNLILDRELCDLHEPQKVNTALYWSGDLAFCEGAQCVAGYMILC